MQVLKVKYFPNQYFWRVSSKQSSSWIWNSLLVGRDLIREGHLWQIGDDNQAKCWEDVHISGHIITLNFQQSQIQLVQELIHLATRRWKLEVVNANFSPEIAQEILDIPLSETSQVDRIS